MFADITNQNISNRICGISFNAKNNVARVSMMRAFVVLSVVVCVVVRAFVVCVKVVDNAIYHQEVYKTVAV